MTNQQGSPPSRRTFLHQLAALGGAGLVTTGLDALGMSMASAQTAPPALSGSGAGRRVVILGAGVAGMTAAYELPKLGYDCQVLEARSFAGGRCQTARAGFALTELGGEEQRCTFDEGQYINHGPWRIPFNHQSTLHYTREFGIPLEVMVNDNDASYAYANGGRRGAPDAVHVADRWHLPVGPQHGFSGGQRPVGLWCAAPANPPSP